jgi:hypothetical protein
MKEEHLSLPEYGEMFGKGSTKKLLDYEETYPASNTRKRYTGNETGQLIDNDVGHNTIHLRMTL